MQPGQDISADIARIEALLERRFGVIRGDFGQRVRKAGSRVPRELRPAMQRLVAASRQAGHPGLARMLDGAALARDAQRVIAGLERLDLADARKGFWLGLAGAMAFNLLLFGALFLGWLMYRGLVG